MLTCRPGTYGVSFALIGYAPQMCARMTLRDADVSSMSRCVPSLDRAARRPGDRLPHRHHRRSLRHSLRACCRARNAGLTAQHRWARPSARSRECTASAPAPALGSRSSGACRSSGCSYWPTASVSSPSSGATSMAPEVESGEAERIEVIRGPASVLYGSDAIEGVVNVIHARPARRHRPRPLWPRLRRSGAYSTINDQPDGTAQLEGASEGLGSAYPHRPHERRRTSPRSVSSSIAGNRAVTGAATAGVSRGWGRSAPTSPAAMSGRSSMTTRRTPATPLQRIGEDPGRRHRQSSGWGVPPGRRHRASSATGAGSSRRRPRTDVALRPARPQLQG